VLGMVHCCGHRVHCGLCSNVLKNLPFVAIKQTTLTTTRFRYYSSPGKTSVSEDASDCQHVTIIRPVKGKDPHLYECLASTFRQAYPASKIHVRFCVSSRDDPAFPTLQQLEHDFKPEYDVRIFVEDEDELLQSGGLQLGPNPKIRNMSRAYREARQDDGSPHVIWVVDCNVWIGVQTLDRMLSKLVDNKFVHQLPLVVDTTDYADAKGRKLSNESSWWSIGGGRLEEMFMATSHPKFYTAINTVLIAPCIVGKSTMFRRFQLDSLTNGEGIDHFSYNICEDHLIGDLLWKKEVPEEVNGVKKLGKHAMCFGDLAIQPMAGVSVGEYWSRRVRWLRVRKFTVTLATLVEPGTESMLCSAYGAFAVTTLPFFNRHCEVPQTWMAFALFWLLSVSIWCMMDRTLYKKLHSGESVLRYEGLQVPEFAKPRDTSRTRPLLTWLFAWLGREILALPIWVWAFWGGTTVQWRGKSFWVGMDMRVHEIAGDRSSVGIKRPIVTVNGKTREG
jgi:ceramide glucosyltransferase